MSKTRRYSDSVAWPSDPFHSTPALLNATSRRPNLSTVKSTIALTSVSFATSARTNAASPPSFLISPTTCAPSFSRRPVRTTFAPARANAIAVALPIPEVPPVTSATLPENVLLFIVFLSIVFTTVVAGRDGRSHHWGRHPAAWQVARSSCHLRLLPLSHLDRPCQSLPSQDALS